ncbi:MULTISPECIES: hypothetical protein [Streptomyces]|uniref:Uncharacterized protein n=1 Tax=Streptomyces yatensis TaxID=155177 RepID=A0ABN2GT96_9ACTN|nr:MULTISPECIES: hypothetical protein [Streptomyces]MCG0287646.1 hypothetical protein [Streptomyces sp. PSAA01]
MPDQRALGDTAADGRCLGTFDGTLREASAPLECGGRSRATGSGRSTRSARSTRRVPLRAVLTYRDVVAFLVRNRARAPEAAAGAVLRQREGPVFLVQTFFLDQEGVPLRDTGTPPAPVWVCRARRLDGELRAAFGDKDLIIFGQEAPSC